MPSKCKFCEIDEIGNEANAKIIEKDKIIDLMAEFIEKVTVDLKIAFGENMLWDRNEIKQYFENKLNSRKEKYGRNNRVIYSVGF